MQPDKHKEGGEADQGKGEDMPSATPPASSASSASSSTSSSSSSSSSSTTTVTTTTTTTTTSFPASSTSASTTSSTARGTHSISDVSSTCSNSSVDSSSVNSNNRVSSAIGVGSSSVGSSLSNSSMGNPFARAAPHASWGTTESCEQRPILAPSRLSSQADSGSKVTSSGVLRPPQLGASGRLGGPLRPATGTSFFPPPTLTVTGSSPPQAAKSEFKLKPAVLGSPNPFAKPVPESPGEKTDGEREGSSRVLGSSKQQEDAAPPVTGTPCQVSSSTPAATTASPKEVTQGTRSPTQTQDTKTTSSSSSSNSSSNTSNTPANSNINTTTSTIGARSLFLPLSRSNNNSDSTSSPTLGNSSFIFGQNLHSKVTSGGAVSSSSSSSTSSSGGGGVGGGWGLATTDAAAPTTNGEKPTGNLFSEAASEVSRWSEGAAGGGGAAVGATLAAAAAAGPTTNGQPHTGNLFSEAASEISRPGEEHQAWGSGQSLAESSRELTEKEKSQKRKFDEVEVITGEENESNVLQMNCKLYAWVSGWWQERGRGILRLNDWDAGGQQGGAETAGSGSGSSKEIRSRLVIRTQGTLTVMLNTKVWAEMSVERASSKSVRFTALDADGQPKIFLAMGSPKDVDLLHNSLEWRVAASRAHTQEETAAESTKKTKTDDNTSPTVPL